MDTIKSSKRPYTMTRRADQAAATQRKILESAIEVSFGHPGVQFTLEEVAHRANISVRTILRIFGSKDGLRLAAFTTISGEHRGHGKSSTPEDVHGGIQVLFSDYEEIGDMVVAQLAEEHRVAGMKEFLDMGRKNHRVWVEETFRPQLDRCTDEKREQMIRTLSVATDVYVWKLLRRDQQLSRPAAEAVMRQIVTAILKED